MEAVTSSSPASFARHLAASARKMHDSMERLATGRQLNRAADSPADLITAESLGATLAAIEAEARALQRVERVSASVDGALGEISNLLVEAEGLAIASASDFLSVEEQQANQMEMDSIIASVNYIAGTTTFNGQSLLDGGLSLSAAGQSLSIPGMAAGALGQALIDGELQSLASVGSGGAFNLVNGNLEGAQQAVSAAADQVNALRGRLGAFQRYGVGARQASLDDAFMATTAARSQLMDTDSAAESARMRLAELEYRAGLSAFRAGDRARRRLLSLLA